MPQIGWFELLIIVVIAILVIGPKDFPLVLRKVVGWIGSIKRYFTEIQKNMEKNNLPTKNSMIKQISDIIELETS